MLAPPRVRLGEPDRVHPRLVHRARGGEHLVERLHRELHDADTERNRHYSPPGLRDMSRKPNRTRARSCPYPPASAFSACTSVSSAARTFPTCWLMIGWRTRWPIEPTGPAIFTSASHAICVVGPSPLSVNDVVMFISAPTPVPFALSDANSSGRSSSFVKAIDIFSPPRPSGTLTFALQCVSSAISKLSTPGIVFAIFDGSLITVQTTSRGASNSFVPSSLTSTSPRPSRVTAGDRGASPRRGGTGCGWTSR